MSELYFEDINGRLLSLIIDNIENLQQIAFYLLGTFAVIEIFFFGVSVALSGNVTFYEALKRILLIGFVVFFVQEFNALIDALLGGFVWIAQLMTGEVALLTPNKGSFSAATAQTVWNTGLETAKQIFDNAGMTEKWPKIFSGVGLMAVAILINFSLIAIQVIVATTIFYFMACVALILIPIGVFLPTSSFIDASLRGLMSASVRVFGVLLIVSVFLNVWSSLQVNTISQSAGFIEWVQVFFVTLLFMILGFIVPKGMMSVVGTIQLQPLGHLPNPSNVSTFTAVTETPPRGSSLLTPALPGASAKSNASSKTMSQAQNTALGSGPAQTVLSSNQRIGSGVDVSGRGRDQHLLTALAQETGNNRAQQVIESPSQNMFSGNGNGNGDRSLPGKSGVPSHIDAMTNVSLTSLIDALQEIQNTQGLHSDYLENMRIASGVEEEDEQDNGVDGKNEQY